LVPSSAVSEEPFREYDKLVKRALSECERYILFGKFRRNFIIYDLKKRRSNGRMEEIIGCTLIRSSD
jgi:hypothetical protein